MTLTYLDDHAPPASRSVQTYQERYVLVAPANHALLRQPEIAWSDAAALELCGLTTTCATGAASMPTWPAAALVEVAADLDLGSRIDSWWDATGLADR